MINYSHVKLDEDQIKCIEARTIMTALAESKEARELTGWMRKQSKGDKK